MNYFAVLNVVDKFEGLNLQLGNKFPIEVNILMDNFEGVNLGNKFGIEGSIWRAKIGE